ncbi:choline/carnitine O-acyltransferase [Phanerochaete sordida]|uniref:Choline/carnitine O-acyltransferase n=1 Tax=Phanerochaete sordida TaxID=48140 RepID=A0A9P3LAN6_9APHY|nr:choline/carnitine O-acyltransferase [Phanerochaete sordida]
MSPSTASSQSSSVSPSAAKAHLWRLPVPDLQQTLDRYLTSLIPVLQEDELHGGEPFEAAFQRQKELCQAFAQGQGKVLQQRLQVLDKQSPHNWLDDNIWLKVYHQWRAPLLVNSNWWAAFQNDQNVPASILAGDYRHDEISFTGLTRWQIKRAAWLVHRAVDCKTKVDRQELHPETTPEGVWLQSTFRRMYNTSRLPRLECDELSEPPPPRAAIARQILLSVYDWLYALEVIDEDLQPLSACEIGARMMAVVQDVARRLAAGDVAVPVCVLSADDRDTWAKNQAYLLSLSPQNQTVLDTINGTLLAVSLDHYTYVSPPELPTPPPSPSLSHPTPRIAPDTPPEIHDHLLNLRAGHPAAPARNRWWDKTFTVVVEANTRAGALGEHSPVDALVPNVLGEHMCAAGVDAAHFRGMDGAAAPRGWARLDWAVDARVRAQCAAAEQRAGALVRDSDFALLVYDAYGRDFIRHDAGLPSDAYVQQAIQRAYHRVHGACAATYETAVTRAFQHGRTEAIRSLTQESRAWVRAMGDASVSAETRHALLHAAAKAHTKLSRAAAAGQGVDRHLLGLRAQRVPWDAPAPAPAALDDALCARSAAWRLSTSSMGAAPNLRGTGFGAVERDGYGINYIVKAGAITFGVESKRSCAETSSRALADALRDALDEMRELCVQCPKPPHVDEKLEAQKEIRAYLKKLKEEQ